MTGFPRAGELLENNADCPCLDTGRHASGLGFTLMSGTHDQSLNSDAIGDTDVRAIVEIILRHVPTCTPDEILQRVRDVMASGPPASVTTSDETA